MMGKKQVLFGAIAGAAAAWYLTQPRFFSSYLLRRPGATSTALITGASSGIGAEFGRQAAARGLDLVLVARRQEQLEILAEKLTAVYGVKVQVLPADLATSAGIELVEARVRALDDLALLVNSAGFATRGRLAKTDPERQRQMVELHVMATMRLTQASLPGMLARHHGAIVNVSSIAAFAPLSGNVNYSATKAYIVTFSKALQAELRGTGVYVQALCPGYTHTEFHSTEEFAGFDKGRLPGFLWLDATDVVAESLADLGTGRAVCVPGRLYRLLAALLRMPGMDTLLPRLAWRR